MLRLRPPGPTSLLVLATAVCVTLFTHRLAFPSRRKGQSGHLLVSSRDLAYSLTPWYHEEVSMVRARVLYGILALVVAVGGLVVAGKIIGNGSPVASTLSLETANK
jgi:phage gpG-like protein